MNVIGEMFEDRMKEEIVDEGKVLVPEVYKDLAKPAVAEVGNVAGRTVKALLSPIRGLLWGWEQIEKLVEESVQKKLKSVPVERLQTPAPEIAVPLIQSLQYTAQNATLRELYINLLSNTMDKDYEKSVHPSFVDIIRKMDKLDAKVFQKLTENKIYQEVVRPKISFVEKDSFLTKATPEWYLGWTIDGYDEFDVSASLVRLSKFGLIDLIIDQWVVEGRYTEIEHSAYLEGRLKLFQAFYSQEKLKLSCEKALLHINEYGLQFKKACE